MSQWMITVDTGTTNTRLLLWQGETLQGEEKAEVGVACTAADGNNNRLKQTIKMGIQRLLAAQKLTANELDCIVACGMITSNVGLFEVPHLIAPVAASALAAGMQQVLLEEISPVPFWFVPGVKNNTSTVDLEHFEEVDMMRGEETEAVALLEQLPKGRSYLLVLPGSHTKFVAVDADGAMVSCLTTLTGELLSALSRHTILANAVNRAFVQEREYQSDLVLAGFRTAQKTGLARASFSTRILHQLGGYTEMQAANYLLGVVLAGDLQALRHSSAIKTVEDRQIVVAGKGVFVRALMDVFAADGGFGTPCSIVPDVCQPLSAKGMRQLYRLRREMDAGTDCF